MIVDDVVITIKAGDGGDGRVSFRREKFVPRGGPDGGNGGTGGDVYFEGVSDLAALRMFRFKKELAAQDGGKGGGKKKAGKRGEDLIIRVPVGTRITDQETHRSIEITSVGERIRAARGGRGGLGNFEFRSAQNQTPREAQPGQQRAKKIFHLNLQYIADIGLIGLPNAGKSSLLNTLTQAHAKIANYPFTTLEPNLGVMNDIIIADIPGLIEGAHAGRGLGHKFLKHISKTKLLVHCIDCTSVDVARDYHTIRTELKKYEKELSEKKEIILLTKSDLSHNTKISKQSQKLKKFKKPILSCSIIDDKSLEKLRKAITK